MRRRPYNVPFRRKREGKTDYRKRLKLLLANKPRLVIRKSLKNLSIQLIEYSPEGDKVIVSVSSRELEKGYNWKFDKCNTVSAYLTGLLLGKKASKKNIKEAILDLGLDSSVKGSKIYAALKGVVDAGIKVPHSKEILPDEQRIKGKHISDYADKLQKENKEKYEKIFSGYLKMNINPVGIEKQFEEVKKKIIG